MKWLFLTDTPPLPDIGHGNHGVSRHLIRILRDHIDCVLTRRYRSYISKQSVESAAYNDKVIFYPDCAGWGVRRFMPSLAGFIDVVFFALWLPWFRIKHGQREMFVLCGSDPWFLLNIWLVQRFGYAVHIYLVDDIEASPAMRAAWPLKPFVAVILRSVLSQSVRVFAISQGFVEYLNKRFLCGAKWLPLPSVMEPPQKMESAGNKRSGPHRIVFVGAINILYAEPLRELHAELLAYNATAPASDKYELEIITYSDPEPFVASLTERSAVSVFRNLPDKEMHEHLSLARACFLPYSFEVDHRAMVSTSFSCKILEYYACGRPILVYGPPYASIPRFFREQRLPLCATSRNELKSALVELSETRDEDFQVRYRLAWDKFHSPDAIRKRLLADA